MTEQPVRLASVDIAPAARTASKADLDGVTQAARDYIEGFIQGDAERHARAYHPECSKRRFVTDDESGIETLQVLSPRIMTDHAAQVGSALQNCQYEIVIDAISDGMATVRISSCKWVDFLHILKARGEWKLFHVTWHDRPSP